ncbi:UNVERIFIED_CONTAM: hypothetical protein PYX00_010829 [Menopon gallinae]|uniref:RNA polymerase alpha subunit n=1 Tax=Menopon gallinae TaxID=328185 RepID=A0AAW2H6D6_9NEOP
MKSCLNFLLLKKLKEKLMLVKETQYTLSDKDLEKYWVKELLPSFDDKGCMQVKKVRLSLDAKEQEIEVLDNAQSLLELPKLLKYSSTRAKIYPARHPITKRPPATLEYKVLLPYSFDKKRESYISDLVFSKNNKTESQPSYLEFEWSSQDCLFQHQESSLLSVKIWAYATACYEKVVYKRNSGDSLEYDSNGFAIIIAAHEYKKNEEKQSLLYGEAQIVPPLKERGKLLKTLKVTLAPSSEKIKVIDNYTKNRAQKLEFEASVGQVWDRMESDLYLSEEMKQHLWIEESFGEDGLRIRYLNLSSNDFTYEVKVYGRSFVKIEQNVRVWENLESQAIYCQREEERENLSDKEIETYLHWHAKPWQSISVETIGNPDLEVGDIIQVLSQQEVLSKAQLIKSVFRLEDGALPISQLTCLGLVNSCCRSLTREFLGSIGEMHLGS